MQINVIAVVTVPRRRTAFRPATSRGARQVPKMARSIGQGLNHSSDVFNNPINNTDPSGFETSWKNRSPAHWGAATTAIAAGFRVGAVGFAEGAGIAGLNPQTSLFIGQYNIGHASDPYSYRGNAPSAAPRAVGAKGQGAVGAYGQNKGGVDPGSLRGRADAGQRGFLWSISSIVFPAGLSLGRSNAEVIRSEWGAPRPNDVVPIAVEVGGLDV